ncbi:hypothetical protein, variant [Aphanomyces astaci]|uniref:TLC domain-containing protein n=2 Tax=Aphanomyces astaci TaxID=112090 RepID=W4FM33_APHAT|nr:hypothetical protein, variant [Aphanomyces astaci]ETV67961.1 hypothetical protein, variant [Aphanomyces astaci]|eukprot:XP_009842523.1 hypothetical protein, variant [Aphanomyces astaci]
MARTAVLLGSASCGLCAGLVYLNKQLAWIGIFGLLFFVVRTCVVPALSTRYVAWYRSTNDGDAKLLWCNTAVSLVHSGLSAALSITVLAIDPIQDWVHSCSPLAVICLSVSTGYFIYDFYDMVVGALYVRAHGILVHHIMVTTCYVMALHCKVAVPYLVVMLLLEINSIWLHSRKLMSMVGFTLANRVYAMTWHALWLSFYTTRVLLPFAVHVGVTLDRHRFPHVVRRTTIIRIVTRVFV